METRIYVDGEINGPETACVPVVDHGFLFGDSVYEVLWWHKGHLVQKREHFERLEASASRLYMELQFTRDELASAIEETLEAAGAGPEDDAYVRLIITRGSGPLGLDFRGVKQRSLVVIVAPATRPDQAAFEEGLHIALVSRLRTDSRALDPRAKTGNYLNNVLALHEARLAGADDAIMLNDAGEVTEATTANVYILRGEVLDTPPLAAGILEGTTRRRVLALCAEHGIEAHERTLLPADLTGADEVFLSSSVRGILPVTAVDGKLIGSGRAGRFTHQMRAWFEAAAAIPE